MPSPPRCPYGALWCPMVPSGALQSPPPPLLPSSPTRSPPCTAIAHRTMALLQYSHSRTPGLLLWLTRGISSRLTGLYSIAAAAAARPYLLPLPSSPPLLRFTKLPRLSASPSSSPSIPSFLFPAPAEREPGTPPLTSTSRPAWSCGHAAQGTVLLPPASAPDAASPRLTTRHVPYTRYADSRSIPI